MPNDAGRQLVAFALGMRCFTCPGTSETPLGVYLHSKNLQKAEYFQTAAWEAALGCVKGCFGCRHGPSAWGRRAGGHHFLNHSPTRNTHHPGLPPGHHPQGPKAQPLHSRPVTTSDPLFQHCLWVSSIAVKEGLSTVSVSCTATPHLHPYVPVRLTPPGVRSTSLCRAEAANNPCGREGTEASWLDAVSVRPSRALKHLVGLTTTVASSFAVSSQEIAAGGDLRAWGKRLRQVIRRGVS